MVSRRRQERKRTISLAVSVFTAAPGTHREREREPTSFPWWKARVGRAAASARYHPASPALSLFPMPSISHPNPILLAIPLLPLLSFSNIPILLYRWRAGRLIAALSQQFPPSSPIIGSWLWRHIGKSFDDKNRKKKQTGNWPPLPGPRVWSKDGPVLRWLDGVP